MLILHRYACLLVCATFGLLVAGGLVTSTDSGLAVPDWPLSYGQWMPPMVGGVFYEHLHRMIASGVGLMTLVFTVWLCIVEKRAWLRWLSIGALAAVVLQGILGGMTVLFLLPAPISIFHACLAQAFFALVVSLAFMTSKEWSDSSASHGAAAGLRRQFLMLTAIIFLQLIFGAAVRHTQAPLFVVAHLVGAFLVLVFIGIVLSLVFRGYRQSAQIFYPTIFLGGLFLVQWLLGVGAFAYTVILPQHVQPTTSNLFFVTSHQTLGALLLATSVFLVLCTYRRHA
jgi:heme a synthase